MKTVPELLRDGAETYEERNKLYGDNYKRHGMVMQALFPDGVQLDTVEDHNRFGILTQMVAKLTRYCQNWQVGGHEDSIHDLMVYTPMLGELDNEQREYLAMLEAEMRSDAPVMGTGSAEAEVQSITPDWSAVEEKFGAVHKDEDAVAQPPIVVSEEPTEEQIDEMLAKMKAPGSFYEQNGRFKNMAYKTPEEEREYIRSILLGRKPE